MPYFFRLPEVHNLTPDQQQAVDETDCICMSGGPGTGKTVVNLWRHIRNYDLGATRSLLLTYTKTLEHYLRASAMPINEEAANNISRTKLWTYGNNRNHYDEIIIDEAQDVTIDRYEIINNHAEKVSYSADINQAVFLSQEQVNNLLNQLKDLFPDNEEFELTKNFRNSREILLFTKSIFPSLFIPQGTINDARTTGIKPIVQLVGWDIEEIVEKTMEIVIEYGTETHNIGILVPSVNQVNQYYDLISQYTVCSKFQNEMDAFNDLENIHITTFKSAKGIEFDTVIIPKFDSYQWFLDNTEIITENDYYVALTRAKINLFLICNRNLNVLGNTYEIE